MRHQLLLGLLLAFVLSIGIQAQNLYPLTVQQFLDEQAEYNRYKSMSSLSSLSSIDDDCFQFVSPHVVDGVEVVDAFIAFDNQLTLDRLQRSGVVINSLFDGFVTAQIPMDRLTAVSQMTGVKDVEISRKLKLCTDSTMSATFAGYVMNGTSHGLPADYDGSGVIVGVIDVGFDFQHRAFRSNDDPSRTRIVRVYNTQDKTGHKAKYNGIYVLPGSVFMDDEIYRLTSDNKNKTHGTHTSSIAAGSNVNGYSGMAPGSDIVLCAISNYEGNVSAVDIANCVRYINSYADSVGQPYVISLSVGTANGQHDGLDYLSKIVSQTMGPGKIFVVAAGNNAGNRFYAHHNSTPTSPLNLMFKCSNSLGGDSTYYYGGVNCDIWMRSSNTNFYYKFHIIDLNTSKIVWESEELANKTTIDYSQLGGYYIYDVNTDTTGYIATETSYVSTGRKYRLEIKVRNLKCSNYTYVSGVRKSRYALGVTVYPRRNVSCEIDAWYCNSSGRFGAYNKLVTTMDGNVVDHFYAAPSDSCCIGTYACGDSTISAGAYAARNSYYSLFQNNIITDRNVTVGEIASFSAYQIAGAGPTGEALPTICAPGMYVVAAGSRYSYWPSSSSTVMKTDDGSYWGVMSGTSMAAPTVAGIIALWLQADPTLSVADVKSILAESAIRDRFTIGKNHDHFGPNGKINALAGMELVLERIKPLMGDVNSDSNVDINDVTSLIAYLLKTSGEAINYEASDIDADGHVTINDLTLLINYLLNNKVW